MQTNIGDQIEQKKIKLIENKKKMQKEVALPGIEPGSTQIGNCGKHTTETTMRHSAIKPQHLIG